MIKEKKNLEAEHKKRSSDGLSKTKSKLNVHGSRSASVSTQGSGSDSSSQKNRARLPGKKLPPGRSAVKCVKRVKGKKGKPDRIELLVTIDLATYKLDSEQIAEYKEVFMLFDKDEDGVLSFSELGVVMKSLGQRPSEKKLLTMVRSVSEDKLYDTIEFNEFLQMMSKQQSDDINLDSLMEAFKIFDKDDDGYLTVAELRRIMTQLGERMPTRELEEMVREADHDNDGLINCQEFCAILCQDGSKRKVGKKKSKENKDRISEDNKENETTSKSSSAISLS